ncbi:hypothetical protein [Nonomuraea guangzhouensis]|uniref:AAA+ ATPase domain-containing protein n=1 Tax=Nonomuraea guangzhouensis TaxID=1291555 RepID=A0ABW4GYB8_9ACTN|nr:hypothetical protein [Nonomuraea guangzhouensis]
MQANPLHSDPALRDLYSAALTRALHDPEIRDAFDYVTVKPLHIRLEMMEQAGEVFAAVVTPAEDLPGKNPPARPASVPWTPLVLVAFVPLALGVAMADWRMTVLVAFAGLVIGSYVILARSRGWADVNDRLRSFPYSPFQVKLVRALENGELTAQIRQRINARRARFDPTFGVVASPGLSESFDSAYHVPTRAVDDLEELLGRLSGASLGIAGPRGSGKSTLIRRYCENHSLKPGTGHLRLLVSAPVEYASRDFVLHLFAAFCRATLRHLGPGRRRRVGLAQVLGLLVYWLVAKALATWPAVLGEAAEGAAVAVGRVLARLMNATGPAREWLAVIADRYADDLTPKAVGLWSSGLVMLLGLVHFGLSIRRRGRRHDPANELRTRARRHLVQIRYLQTQSVSWSGTVKFPAWVDAQLSGGRSLTEQPLSYPEIVSAFRSYVRDVADRLQPDHNVYIGIDELDKIGSGERAERFLNEIKGIFGLPHTYFMISVSDDAMSAFERRGLPFRDAFDSSFDEIVRVGPLSYTESMRFLYRRVVGLTEPYIAFCHCLSGGMSRDLLRAARAVIRAAHALPSAALTPICLAVLKDEVRKKSRALMDVADDLPDDVLDLLHDLAHRRSDRTPRETLRSLPHGPLAEPALEFAAYLYFCATLEEIFTGELTGPGDADAFDGLAAARHAFAFDTRLAWRTISAARRAWALRPYDLPVGA